MKLLVICPSYNRPDLLSQMVVSFVKTATFAHLIVVFDENDPKLDEGRDICREYGIPCLYSFGDTITQCLNTAFLACQKYNFYAPTNDDVIYHTPGWDEKLCVKHKISYGDDSIQGEGLCTFPVIDGDFVRALGWIQMPLLTKYCGDTVWMDIGRMRKCLNYVPEVKIEHLHFINNKRPNDDMAFQKTYDHDRMMYANWLANYSINDHKKIKGVLNGHQPDSQ